MKAYQQFKPELDGPCLIEKCPGTYRYVCDADCPYPVNSPCLVCEAAYLECRICNDIPEDFECR